MAAPAELVALAVIVCGGVRGEEKKSSGPSLDTMKKLVGEWVMVGKDGKPTDQVASSMRVTANGSAVVETLFPGTPHEMLSVYFMDGDDLV